MSLAFLFGIFFYVGLFTIGGGLVAISLMQQEIVARGLISPERFFSMVAVSESTPGAIGINLATYIGNEFYGLWGGIITTMGTVLPSLIVIILIARHFGKFQEKPLVQDAFYGLRAGSTGMIAVAAWNVFFVSVLTLPRYRETRAFADVVDWKALILFAVTAVLYRRLRWHPVVFILFGAVVGVLFL